MPDLPLRPREHELESESRNAFRSLIESAGWVVRPIDDPDYGLDDLVEIFESGTATGLLFYTQVRATDEPDLHRALAVRVRAQQQNYFVAIGHPVLLVRYHAPTRRLFSRWFHRFDPHPRHGGETLRLLEDDELTGGNVRALSDEVRLYRALTAADIRWPVLAKVASTSEHRADDLAVAMAATVGTRQHFVQFVPADEMPDSVGITINVLGDSVVIHGGASSVTLHATDEWSVDEVATNAVLSVGVVLGMMGHLDAGATFITTSAAHAAAFTDQIAALAVGILVRGGRVREALRLGYALADQGRLVEAQLVATLVAAGVGERIQPDDVAPVVDFMQHLAELAEAAGDPLQAAALSYSLGNYIFHAAFDWIRARAAYIRAAELDPSYLERDYYRRELAAATFECGAYVEAANLYQSLCDELPEDLRLIARFGDALLAAGEYGRAAEALARYAAAPDPAEPIWLTKYRIASFLVEHGYERQERDEEGAQTLVDQLPEEPDAARLAAAREVLRRDALNAGGWYVLAEGSPQLFPMSLVIMATSARSPDFWAAALLSLVEADDVSTAGIVAATAVSESGAEVADAVRRARDAAPDLVDRAMAIIGDAGRTSPGSAPALTLRMPDESGQMVELRVSGDE